MCAIADRLLTIAIPTFNRAEYLDTCLSHIYQQMGKDEPRVEILVSNNHSTDSTDDIVKKYISVGYPMSYLKNESNIGPDDNFIQCFEKAAGKYVLLLGDDDILLEGSLKTILGVLEKGDYGIVHLNSYGFIPDFISEGRKQYRQGYVAYSDRRQFVKKVSYFLTFISVNIINKSLVHSHEVSRFRGTNLIQLGWTLSALLKGQQHVYVQHYAIAAKLYHSGGYRLCEVFGVRFNKILDEYMSEETNRELFEIINRKLASKFFPANIIRARKNLIGTLPENYYEVLYPIYRKYLSFWLLTVPAIVLPLPVVYPLFLGVDRIRRFIRRVDTFFS